MSDDYLAATRRSYVLIVLAPQAAYRVVLPMTGRFRVGRSAGCGLVIDDASISRVHAEFMVSEHGCRIRDLRSKNGTFVRGLKLEDDEIEVLCAEDSFELGRVQFILQRRRVSLTATEMEKQLIQRPNRSMPHEGSSASSVSGG